jgi:hypothetical protein
MTNRDWIFSLPRLSLYDFLGTSDLERALGQCCSLDIYNRIYQTSYTPVLCWTIICADCREVWLDRECLWPEIRSRSDADND